MGTNATMAPTETPILDGRAPLPVRRQNAGFAAGAFLGFLFTVAIAGALVFTGADLSLSIALVIATRYVQVVVHEGGHAIAGLWMRFRFQSLTVWPFDLIASSGPAGGLRLRFDRKARQSVTEMIPPLSVSGSRLAFFHAGGIAANALSALAASLAFVATGGPRSLATLEPGPHAIASALAWATMSIGTQLALSNLVPYRERTHPSDGAQIYDDLARNDRFRRGRAIARLSRALSDGSALTAMPDELAAACVPDDGSRQAMRGHTFAYRAKRELDPVDAAGDLERALASSAFANPAERRSLFVEACTYAAHVRGDPEQTRYWYDRSLAETPSAAERLRLTTGLAYASGDFERAIDQTETLRRELPETVRDASARAKVDAAAEKLLAIFRASLARER